VAGNVPMFLQVMCIVWVVFIIVGMFSVSIKKEDRFVWDYNPGDDYAR
jgi:hypothetical protein